MNGLEYLDRLTAALSRLPGVGRRSAERMAYRLAWDPDGVLRELLDALREAQSHVRLCGRCGGITTAAQNPCRLCTNTARDSGVLCVVQDPSDIIAIERTGSYKGRYHALMGIISPMHGEGPRDLRLASLIKRIADERFEEVILALGTDVESESTASYITELLKSQPVRVTRLASGIPAGSGIGYADPVTLSRAVRGRRTM